MTLELDNGESGLPSLEVIALWRERGHALARMAGDVPAYPRWTFAGEVPDCDADPCERHKTCHCNCVCMPDGADNCDACTTAFAAMVTYDVTDHDGNVLVQVTAPAGSEVVASIDYGRHLDGR